MHDCEKLIINLQKMRSTEYCVITSAPDFPAYKILREAICAIEKLLTVPKWISVKERLPESDDWVIVAILDERGDTPYQYTDFGWYLDAARCWIVDTEQRRDITHWMPLPEPPKEVQDG